MNLSYEQLLLENDALRETVFRLENLVQKLEARITHLDTPVAQLEARNAQLEKRNAQLEERNTQLEAQLNQNSTNSSNEQKIKSTAYSTLRKKTVSSRASRQLLPENMLSSRETRYVQVCPRCRSLIEPTEIVAKPRCNKGIKLPSFGLIPIIRPLSK
jgi:hypothetical protein